MMRFAPALLLAALIVASPSAQAQWRGNGYRPAPYYAGPGPSFGIGIVAGMLPLVAGAIAASQAHVPSRLPPPPVVYAPGAAPAAPLPPSRDAQRAAILKMQDDFCRTYPDDRACPGNH
jgi:hypothetical protein